MKTTKISHAFIGSMLNDMNKDSLRTISNSYIAALKKEAEGSTYGVKEQEFLTVLFKNVDLINYFIIPTVIPNEPSIGIVNKDLNAVMFFTVNTTNLKFLDLYKSSHVLDLMHLHSFKIGEGKKLLEIFKRMQKELNIPGSLFTETRKNVRYFSKHGFKSLGQLGEDQEYLMIFE